MIGYPKTPTKKLRMRHPKSILQEKDGTCYLCVILHEDYRIHKDLQEHHIFSGHRKPEVESEQYGLKVYLCRTIMSMGRRPYIKTRSLGCS